MAGIRTCRPESTRPKMKVSDRAKQFAPYAALGRLDDVLLAMEAQRKTGDPEHVIDLSDFSEEEIALMLAENTIQESEEM